MGALGVGEEGEVVEVSSYRILVAMPKGINVFGMKDTDARTLYQHYRATRN